MLYVSDLLWLIAQQIHSIIGSNEDGIEGGVEFELELFCTGVYKYKITLISHLHAKLRPSVVLF